MVQLHARADDDQIRAQERLWPMTGKFEGHATVDEIVDAVDRLLQIGQRHARAAAQQQIRGSDATPRCAHDDDVLTRY
jgi:hypothetical protein